jgi:hypothetical protein
VTFSGPVNSLEADTLGTYRLATPGKKGSYTAKNAGIIKLKKAVYTASNNTVALTPKKPFALTKPVQVLVYGTGRTALQDTAGLSIDGDHNGTAGGNAVAILTKKSVIIDAVELTRTRTRQALRVATIDAVFETGHLTDLQPIRRTRFERHANLD